MLWVATMQLLLSIVDTVSLVCRSCGVHMQAVLSLYGMLECIMAYGSTPYVGMTPKKMAATLKVHK